MKCRYCNIALAPLRSLTDGEFCCDDHRHAYSEEQAARNEVSIQEPPLGKLLALGVKFLRGYSGRPAPLFGRLELRELHPVVCKPAFPLAQSPLSDGNWAPPACDWLLPLQFTATPEDAERRLKAEVPGNLDFPFAPSSPRCDLDPVRISMEVEPEPAGHTETEARPSLEPAAVVAMEAEASVVHSYRDIASSWHWLRDAWRNAPSDLKIVTILLPILLAVAIGPWVRKMRVHNAPRPSITAKAPPISTGSVQQAVTVRLNNLHQTILNRAAVDFSDDFRSGLDAWDSRSKLTSSWSYDASGFVQPGPLAIFKPTEDMTDYRFQFLGEIDQKALGCAFRAANLDNYYAVKFTVVKPGPLPLVRLVRYAVINGKEGRHIEKPLPISARPDTLYRVVVDVRGSDFTIMAQGQVVDFWSDSSLPRGGVGFFCARGEKARVRWVEVSHQYDALGRLCAYLAPYGFEGRNGNWN